MPFNDQCGISRKIDDPKERDRLRKILRELDMPEGMGVIMRTVGQGQRARYFVRDLSILARDSGTRSRRGIEEQAAPGLPVSGARSDRAHRARLPHRRNRRGDHRRSQSAVNVSRSSSARSPRARANAFNSTPARSRFSTASTSRRRSTTPSTARSGCPCGGYIVIDETEALDRHRRQHRPQQGRPRISRRRSSKPTSKPPTKSAARLRLRNIGGLIIVRLHRHEKPQGSAGGLPARRRTA